MIEEIHADVRATVTYIEKDALDKRVLDVMSVIPRHAFVPQDQKPHAYENRPLPIGHGQTISQPYIVALMTDLIRPLPGHRSLEIGTGSGYQAAVLAGLVDTVYTIEIIEPLGKAAATRFAALGYPNIVSKIGDGYYGWESQAPFDSIVVTAASSQIPPPLINQLKPGGRMIIPIGGRFQVQQLMLVEKQQSGALSTRQLLPVRFVPLTGEH
ncbi:MAG: protein-L-isoaspartate(D-aspartate) O-methyltransferase [Gammaproteobacteria bacterium]|nr:protein-L-isoaspartate(D-aspartate) O-methyltransferase [Gammaproteobacteria bacterium]